MRAFVCAILLMLGATVSATVAPNIAHAHAELMRANPAPDSIIANPPSQVEVWFSEPPELRFSEVQALDRTGRQVDRGDLRKDPTDNLGLIISVNPLSTGTYTVVWKALSAVDGHVTRGVYVFTVGLDQTPSAPVITGGMERSTATPDQVIVRLVTYIGLFLLLAVFPFVQLILLPAFALGMATVDTREITLRHTWTLACVGAGLSLLGALGALIAQTATAYSVPFFQAIGPGMLSVAFGTRFGLLWWTRVLLVVALAAIVFTSRRSPPWRALSRIGVVLGLAVLLVHALGTHAAAVPDSTPAAVAFDWLHLMASATWLGGLGYLALAAWTLTRHSDARERTRVAARLVPRFSTLAGACVAIIFFTGVYQAWLHVGSVQALVATPYGQALLVKLGLIAPILGLAAFNLLVLSPRLRAARERDPQQDDLVRRLRQSVAGETILVVAVLVVVGVMTNIQPAREALVAQGIERTVAAEDLRVTVRVQPGVAAVNRFDVLVTDRNGRAIGDADRVALRFNMPTMDMGESELVAASQGNGHYVTQGGAMAMAGNWQVTVLVRRSGRDDVRANLTLDIQPAPPPNASPAAPRVGEANLVLGVELLVSALVAGGYAVWAFRRRSRVIRWAAPLAAFALIAGAGLTVQGVRALAVSTVQNPIPPSAASIDRGRDIYVQNCAVCHGINGRGDGPAGLSLVPRPSDFRVHLAAGHTDAQLFDWISNGFPGTAMPAWRDTLSEEDRWHVINYIKTTFGTTPNPVASPQGGR